MHSDPWSVIAIQLISFATFARFAFDVVFTWY
jgi:hypothetical protein